MKEILSTIAVISLGLFVCLLVGYFLFINIPVFISFFGIIGVVALVAYFGIEIYERGQ
jgi:hypothetical protein